MFNPKKTLSKTLLVVILAVLLAISISLIILLKYWSIPFLLLIILNLAIFLSLVHDQTIPYLGGEWLHKACLHAKWQAFFFKDKPFFSNLYLLKLKFFYILTLLFKDSQESFLLAVDYELPEEASGSKAKKSKQDLTALKAKQAYLAEYYRLHQHKQKQATIASFLISGSAILLSVIISLIITIGYSKILPSSAATFGWLQTDWSGGASASTATHAANRTGWTNFSTSTGIMVTSTGPQLLRETNGVN